jgi:two-component system NtrC family response regulator
VDVRVIAATNRDLEDAVKKGAFREDLYYRLNVMQIVLPPLRDRLADVPLLADFYVDAFNREFRKVIRGASPEALDVLKRYRWPGNVRELRNAIERAMLLADGPWLTPDLLPLAPAHGGTASTMELPAEGVNLETLERELVVQALRRTGGNQTKAATLLGLNRDQIRYRIEKFGLEKTGS